MRQWILILGILLLAVASGAEAGGRWGVRIELPFQAVTYAEQVAWSTDWPDLARGPLDLIGLEALVGTEAIYESSELAVAPYVGVAAYWPSAWWAEWVRLEVTAPYRVDANRLDYGVSLSVGGSWD